MIKIRHLSKFYKTDRGPVKAVIDLSLDVDRGTFYTLLGPSGCGKTTTLRCVAGLENPESGEIYIDDKLVVSPEKKQFVPPHKRNIGMVFQSYAIWPHMDVFANVAFPLSQGKQKFAKDVIREKVAKALNLVRLGGLEKRPSTQLSGGQQQRLALARALVNEPKLLLLDEPLSNLDAKLREEMRVEIKDLVRRLGITTLYVTHDQLEALAMSDTVNIMNNGELIQTDSPMNIYRRPKNKFVASFIGASNILEGTIEAYSGPKTIGKINTTFGSFSCWLPDGVKQSDKVFLMGRPEDIELYTEKPPFSDNIVEGEVKSVLFLGDSIDCRITVQDKPMHLKLAHDAKIGEIGSKVYIHIAPEHCTVITAE